jgi:hypothetical protein
VVDEALDAWAVELDDAILDQAVDVKVATKAMDERN